jgi:hypothetical protein
MSAGRPPKHEAPEEMQPVNGVLYFGFPPARKHNRLETIGEREKRELTELVGRMVIQMLFGIILAIGCVVYYLVFEL